MAIALVAASCGAAVQSAGASTPAPVGATAVRGALAGGPSAGTTAAATLPNVSATVSLGEHFFDPPLLVVRVGTTVTWRWLGQQVHDVNARDGSFRSPLLGPGGTFSFTFTGPGRYPYFCEPHQGDGMVGEVDVR